LGPTSLRSSDGLHYWRERIFHYFSISVVFIGLIVYLYLGLSFIKEGEFAYAIFASFVFYSAVFAPTVRSLAHIHISEPTRQEPISYALIS
jgi:hypothetical protein